MVQAKFGTSAVAQYTMYVRGGRGGFRPREKLETGLNHHACEWHRQQKLEMIRCCPITSLIFPPRVSAPSHTIITSLSLIACFLCSPIQGDIYHRCAPVLGQSSKPPETR